MPCRCWDRRRRRPRRRDDCPRPPIRRANSRAANAANDIPERAELIILLEMHLQLRGAGTNVIGKGQRALPLARRVWSAEMLQALARCRDTTCGVTGIFGICADCCGEMRCESGSDGTDATPGVVGSPGKLKHVSRRTALHAGVGHATAPRDIYRRASSRHRRDRSR